MVNALESMDEGGRLTISQRRKDNMAEIVFKDTGCGMTSEVLENIFEPFFTRSRTGKGTGLGLTILAIGLARSTAATWKRQSGGPESGQHLHGAAAIEACRESISRTKRSVSGPGRGVFEAEHMPGESTIKKRPEAT